MLLNDFLLPVPFMNHCFTGPHVAAAEAAATTAVGRVLCNPGPSGEQSAIWVTVTARAIRVIRLGKLLFPHMEVFLGKWASLQTGS